MQPGHPGAEGEAHACAQQTPEEAPGAMAAWPAWAHRPPGDPCPGFGLEPAAHIPWWSALRAVGELVGEPGLSGTFRFALWSTPTHPRHMISMWTSLSATWGAKELASSILQTQTISPQFKDHQRTLLSLLRLTRMLLSPAQPVHCHCWYPISRPGAWCTGFLITHFQGQPDQYEIPVCAEGAQPVCFCSYLRGRAVQTWQKTQLLSWHLHLGLLRSNWVHARTCIIAAAKEQMDCELGSFSGFWRIIWHCFASVLV